MYACAGILFSLLCHANDFVDDLEASIQTGHRHRYGGKRVDGFLEAGDWGGRKEKGLMRLGGGGRGIQDDGRRTLLANSKGDQMIKWTV